MKKLMYLPAAMAMAAMTGCGSDNILDPRVDLETGPSLGATTFDAGEIRDDTRNERGGNVGGSVDDSDPGATQGDVARVKPPKDKVSQLTEPGEIRDDTRNERRGNVGGSVGGSVPDATEGDVARMKPPKDKVSQN